MPLAGGFLTKNQIPNEITIPLKVYFCHTCSLVQILDIVDPQLLFENYFYISSVIPSLTQHFNVYATFLKKTYLSKKNATLLEFGCNDGPLLQHLTDITAIGIDPSENVSQLAREKGLKVITGYFTQQTAKEIKKTYGTMDVVTGSNVFAHIDDIHEIMNAAKIILKPNGVFIIEVHYVGDLLKDFQYDTIYHEHLSYYSVIALRHLFKHHGMNIIDVQHLAMHGGGIRVIAAFATSNHKPKDSVQKMLQQEHKQQVDTIQPFKQFSTNAQQHKKQLIKLLQKIKKEGKRIVGYGAAGRATILLNYCGIDKSLLDYIVDVSPLRAGKLMPGVHIPIYTVEKIRRDNPDYILILAWNYADSIMKQEKELQKKGTHFIIPFPTIQII
jgi:SAM-dependent methyltransferase